MIEINSIKDSISLEYELVEIAFEQEELSLHNQMVCDDSELSYGPIEYDEDGIPKGQSMAEIRKRQEIIKTFYNTWLEANPDASVYNEVLAEKIYVMPVSVGEAMEHSSKNYRSTITIKHLTEILQKARPVGRVPIKVGNKRQSKFEYMLIMTYELSKIGKIKLTVGVVKKNSQRVEYGLTALKDGEMLINRDKKKKAPHKK